MNWENEKNVVFFRKEFINVKIDCQDVKEIIAKSKS